MRRHRRKKRKKPTEPEFVYDPTVWQFQLMPVNEMDFDEFIAMAEYYASQAAIGPIGSAPSDRANTNDDFELPF